MTEIIVSYKQLRIRIQNKDDLVISRIIRKYAKVSQEGFEPIMLATNLDRARI